MELSLWPSGRCTLLWVAFLSQQPPRGNEGWGEGLAEAVMAGQWGWAPPHPPLPLSPHGHVKVAFCRETPEGGDQRRVAETEVQMSRQHLSKGGGGEGGGEDAF